jgi:uncharacterized membrane protein YecN with MAPEG domain
MSLNPVPISTLFIGLNGFVAFALSYIVVMERTSTRVWHGVSQEEVAKMVDRFIEICMLKFLGNQYFSLPKINRFGFGQRLVTS